MSYASFGQECDSARQSANGDMVGAAFWVGNYEASAIQSRGGTVQDKPNTYGYYDGGMGGSADQVPCDLAAYNAAYVKAFANTCMIRDGLFQQDNAGTLLCAFAAPSLPQPTSPPQPVAPPPPASNKTIPIVLGLGAVALLAWALL